MPAPLGKILFLLLLAIALSLGVAAIDTSAATLTVTKTEDTNDGVCDADCSLREAVVAAASGDTVVFSSLFNSPQTITLTLGQIAIDKNLTITGTGPNLVDISGNNASRHFFITGGVTVNISGLTFRDGDGSVEGAGGAIWVTGSTLNVSNATFTNNRVFSEGCQCGLGGAIFGLNNSTFNLSHLVVMDNFSPRGLIIQGATSMDIQDSVVRQNTSGGIGAITLNVERCIVSDNAGISAGVGGRQLTISDSTVTNNIGGGVADGGTSSTMTIERCLISGNTRNPTGGGVLSSGTTTIKDSQILNNTALGEYGGGISNLGTLHMINSVVSGNRNTGGGSEDGGGGIKNSVGVGILFVTNSTVTGNTAVGNPGVGGGIYNSNFFEMPGRVYLANSTIANNTSSGAGAGVRIDPPNGEATFSNTIVSGNVSNGTFEEDVSGTIISNGINLIGNTFGSSGWIAGDLLNVNPLLEPLADNGGPTMTHAFLPGSPAINAGNNSLAIDPQTQLPLTVDQRGFLRFYGGTVDIGAYELQPEITGTITYGNATGSPTPLFVSGVVLSGTGSPNVAATTSTNGTYILGGFGSSSYTVTPSKTGDANGISSFDAGLIARHAAGITPLKGNQLIVADVSGNGTISSFDAGQIARYTAGLNGFGTSGNWVFMPANRFYPSVTSTLTGEDFIALLMGDVSGNWTDQGGRTTGTQRSLRR